MRLPQSQAQRAEGGCVCANDDGAGPVGHIQEGPEYSPSTSLVITMRFDNPTLRAGYRSGATENNRPPALRPAHSIIRGTVRIKVTQSSDPAETTANRRVRSHDRSNMAFMITYISKRILLRVCTFYSDAPIHNGNQGLRPIGRGNDLLVFDTLIAS